MTVKRNIETYEEFLAALQAKKSDDRVERNEAKNALGILRIKYPKQFEKNTKWHEGIEEMPPIIPAKPRKPLAKAGDKEQYIREHPELSLKDLRDKARAKLMKGPYGLGLRAGLPSWISDSEVLSSFEMLTISDLITASGNLIQREPLQRKCIKLVVADRRFDEEKLRKTVQSMFSCYYNCGIVGLKDPSYFAPVRRMLYEDTTIDELLYVTNNGNCSNVDIGRLIDLINSRNIRFTEEDIRRIQKKKAKRSKNAEKRAKRRAEKEAALKKTLEEENKDNTENN